jgi:peptidoglycan/LPS O-acetylase OafA/YrhL
MKFCKISSAAAAALFADPICALGLISYSAYFWHFLVVKVLSHAIVTGKTAANSAQNDHVEVKCVRLAMAISDRRPRDIPAQVRVFNR